MRLRPSKRNSPSMPANGRYDRSGIKKLHRLRFSGGGLFLLPEFGRKSKFFCFKTSNSQKRLAFLKKVWYTVSVIGYLCPNASNKSAVWQKRIRREGSCAEKILVRAIRHFAWERWRSKPSTGNAVIRYVPCFAEQESLTCQEHGWYRDHSSRFSGRFFFAFLGRLRKQKRIYITGDKHHERKVRSVKTKSVGRP